MLIEIVVSVLVGAAAVCYLLRKVLAKKVVEDVASIVDVPLVPEVPVVPIVDPIPDDKKAE